MREGWGLIVEPRWGRRAEVGARESHGIGVWLLHKVTVAASEKDRQERWVTTPVLSSQQVGIAIAVYICDRKRVLIGVRRQRDGVEACGLKSAISLPGINRTIETWAATVAGDHVKDAITIQVSNSDRWGCIWD